MAERQISSTSQNNDSDDDISLNSGDSQNSQGKMNFPLSPKKWEQMLQIVVSYSDSEILSPDAIKLLDTIPEGYIPVPHQIGGHKHVNGKPGLLRKLDEPNVLLKPYQQYPKGCRELDFYSLIGSHEANTDVIELRKYVPQYLGLANVENLLKQSNMYIKLEDLAYSFKRASIIDLKIGKKVCEEGTDENKVIRTKQKYPEQELMGFRIVGIRVYQAANDNFKYYDRTYGSSLHDEESVYQGLANYFDNGQTLAYDVIPKFIEKLTEIKNWFEKQSTFNLFATSLLLIYEGAPSIPESDFPRIDVKLVDFAHAYFVSEVDIGPNCLYGISKVIEFFERLENERPTPFLEPEHRLKHIHLS